MAIFIHFENGRFVFLKSASFDLLKFNYGFEMNISRCFNFPVLAKQNVKYKSGKNDNTSLSSASASSSALAGAAAEEATPVKPAKGLEIIGEEEGFSVAETSLEAGVGIETVSELSVLMGFSSVEVIFIFRGVDKQNQDNSNEG
jgi:hypothetical protein